MKQKIFLIIFLGILLFLVAFSFSKAIKAQAGEECPQPGCNLPLPENNNVETTGPCDTDSGCGEEPWYWSGFWICLPEDPPCPPNERTIILKWPLGYYFSGNENNPILNPPDVDTGGLKGYHATRAGRTGGHRAVDLYSRNKEPVLAIIDGVVVGCITAYYGGTSALLVYNPYLDITILYGEITCGRIAGRPIRAGDVIGWVKRSTGPPLHQDEMLHLMVFNGRLDLSNFNSMRDRAHKDPTPLLRQIYQNYRNEADCELTKEQILKLLGIKR